MSTATLRSRGRILRQLCNALALALPLMTLSACQSTPSPAPVPARMVTEKTTAQCIAQMQSAAQRPGAGRVVLTPAAFATEDRLRIVPSDTVVDAAGQTAGGRLLGVPDSFRLKLRNGVCTMVREADAQATTLPACTCLAMQ
ncbi:MAG: hypothetical protein V4858_29625 [Pseudomonadota bacterium]